MASLNIKASSAHNGQSKPHTVHISLPSPDISYDIIIGENVLTESGNIIGQKLGVRRCLIVSDKNIASIYLKRMEAVLTSAGHNLLSSFIIECGEASKDFATLQNLLNHILAAGADRKTLIIALGGGVVGDLAGVAASLAMRGMDFIQIPTTLLAQVDSSVGGKTGVNSAYGKNTIGAFYQPKLVLADVSTLDSLPERELKAGYAEVVKYGLIQDEAFFNWCQQNGENLIMGNRAAQIQAIQKCCGYKAEIVAADEKESGIRALLNFGHTFGHALESFTGYGTKLLHGEAVAIGMAMAFRLSAQLGLCAEEDAKLVTAHLTKIGLPTMPPHYEYDVEQLMELMGHDKKADNGKLTLILTRGIGNAFISKNANPSPVRELWRSVIN